MLLPSPSFALRFSAPEKSLVRLRTQHSSEDLGKLMAGPASSGDPQRPLEAFAPS